MPTKKVTFAAVDDEMDVSGSADGPSHAIIQVEGSGTITLLPEAQVKGAAVWVNIQATNLNTGTAATSITAAGLYLLENAGMNARLRCSVATTGNLTAIANITGGQH